MFLLDETGGELVYYGAGGYTYAAGSPLDGKPKLLGRSWYYVHSATPGRVWLTFLDSPVPAGARDLRAVSEVTVDGKVTVPPGARPPCPGPTVIGAVKIGLLCQSDQKLKLFSPQTGRVKKTLPGPFLADTHGNLAAWCQYPCRRMHVNDLATGTDQTVASGSKFRFDGYGGAFSPDGSLLALSVAPAKRSQPSSLVLVDVRTGRSRPIPGSQLGGSAFAWSPSGDRLFFVGEKGSLMSYRPGSARARPLPIRLGDVNVLGMTAR